LALGDGEISATTVLVYPHCEQTVRHSKKAWLLLMLPLLGNDFRSGQLAAIHQCTSFWSLLLWLALYCFGDTA
jgi:hypothetical protein